MVITEQQQEAINWALDELQKEKKNSKIYTIIAFSLSILDVVFVVLTSVYALGKCTLGIMSILSSGAWITKYAKIFKIEKIIKALKYPAMFGFAYILTRKRRSEFMQNIKIKNWIIAGLNILAIIVGVILVFVEPNVITDNIIAFIMTLSGLLGVNIAIPCFNNAKVTEQEKLENSEKRKLREIKKEAKLNIKAEKESQLNAEVSRILEEKSNQEVQEVQKDDNNNK